MALNPDRLAKSCFVLSRRLLRPALRPPATLNRRGPTVADFTLANGLELVVIPDHRAPVVTHMVWYKVGAADETPGKSGLAHFLEHLMFKGTAKNPTRALLAGRRRRWRARKRIHLQRLYRLLPAHPRRSAQIDDGIRGRPHDRPQAHRRGSAARARRDPRRREHAHREQSARAAGHADRCGALSQPPLRQADDRLAP